VKVKDEVTVEFDIVLAEVIRAAPLPLLRNGCSTDQVAHIHCSYRVIIA